MRAMVGIIMLDFNLHQVSFLMLNRVVHNNYLIQHKYFRQLIIASIGIAVFN